MNKRNRTILIIIIIMVSLLVVGGSYAYWLWTSNVNKNVVFNTMGDFEEYIVYDEGDSYFIGNFQPTDSFCESVNNTISFYKKAEVADVQLLATIHMDINSIGTNIAASNDVYWIVTSGDNSITCEDGFSSSSVLSYGTFNGVAAGDTLDLLTEIDISLTEQKYTIWIWIDNASASLSNLSGETIDTNVWTEITMYGGSGIQVSAPVLDDGMIPVTISQDGVATTVSASDSSWYNYANKEWANVVLVDNDSRSTYKNTSGVTVDSSDILAYYVWIPRYKYKIWTTSKSSTGNEQTIDIVFEDKNTPKSTGTQVGQYRTHPAFTFGNNELNGIWVGKFETTGNATTPTVLPNKSSLRNQNISTQFTTSLMFAGGTLTDGNVSFSGSSTYGLTNATDSHVAKNSEWGAVAYLSHSQYGINQEIYINNSRDYTGRSGGNVSGSVNVLATQYSDDSLSTSAQYNSQGYYTWTGQIIDSSGIVGDYASDRTLGTKASTTGNVTGVYDMSGGVSEYIMGVLSDSNGNPMSGTNSSNNSGFNGIIYDSGNNTEYTSGITFPDSKYYDLYMTTSTTTACNGSICYGHALSETASWYSDTAFFVNATYPWFSRGGSYNSGASAGALRSDTTHGFVDSYRSWRSVLAIS